MDLKTKGNKYEGPRFSERSRKFRAACLVLKRFNSCLPQYARIAGARRRTQESLAIFCQRREEMEQNKLEKFDNGAIETQQYNNT